MLHLESFKRYSERDFTVSDGIDYIDQQIRRYTKGPFKININIRQQSNRLVLFPREEIPTFLDVFSLDYIPNPELRQHYHYWTIKFQYYWQHDEYVANKYFAKKLFDIIKRTNSEYCDDIDIVPYGQEGAEKKYKKNEGEWLNVYVEPTMLYRILDKYLNKETERNEREWSGTMTFQDIKKCLNECEKLDLNPDLVSFFA